MDEFPAVIIFDIGFRLMPAKSNYMFRLIFVAFALSWGVMGDIAYAGVITCNGANMVEAMKQ